MSNTYGFDFLKSEHLESGSAPSVAPPVTLEAVSAHDRSDLEKQFELLRFLQNHRDRSLAPPVIYKATGIDLDVDINVAEMLQRNPKVRVEMVPDPENPSLMVATYAYQAKYSNVRDRTSLLAQINRMPYGIPMRDLIDSYPTVELDLQTLITSGDIIASANTEDKDRILFPRGDEFIVELDGLLSMANNTSVFTDVDPTTQIRRGEAIQVGGQWFRVSSAVVDGPLSKQPARAQAPLSVVSLTDLSKRNEADGYIREFSSRQIPLDNPLSSQAVQNIQVAKLARERLLKVAHGRSGGIGQLLGSNAHASNPATLASSLGTRKRPKAGAMEIKKDVETAAADPALALYSHARRHGCTMDVRQMYLETRSLVPESDADLHKLLLKHKLLEPSEQLRRPRLAKSNNVDNDGKPKKRRYYERKNQRMTNTHLEGTEIGAVLARAAEKQKQGEAVGDGGM